jgi:DNA-binding response OmpR family regulator
MNSTRARRLDDMLNSDSEGQPGRLALVVDDEADLAELVADYLERDGFQTEIVTDGLAAVAAARQSDPDLVVLDLGLPGLDGIEVCRQIRLFSDCYILMLTARADEVDTLVGLSVGADDYMSKPFSPREVAARGRVLFRRPRPSKAGVATIVLGELAVDTRLRQASLSGVPLELTKTEFDILAFLAAHSDTTLTRESIMSDVWAGAWVGDPRAVDVHVTHIRAKIGPEGANYIRTVRGVGYVIGDGTEPAGRGDS